MRFLFFLALYGAVHLLSAQICQLNAINSLPIAERYPYAPVDGELKVRVVLVDLMDQGRSSINNAGVPVNGNPAISVPAIMAHLQAIYPEIKLQISTQTRNIDPSEDQNATLFIQDDYTDDVGDNKVHLVFGLNNPSPPGGQAAFHFTRGVSNAPNVPSTRAIVLLTANSTQEEVNYLAAHELGHCFGLFHPFRASITPTPSRPMGVQVRCSEVDDGICDLKGNDDLRGDLQYNANLGHCQLSINSSLDPNDYNFVSLHNVMNYFDDSRCAQAFSPEQVLKMRYVIAKHAPLRNCLDNAPNIADIPEVLGLVEIRQNTVWNSPKVVAGILIAEGASLQVNNTTIYFYPSQNNPNGSIPKYVGPVPVFRANEEDCFASEGVCGKLVITPGADLQATNSTFTIVPAYRPFRWNGIFVEGNTSAGQANHSQGWVKLESCTLKNAVTAVQTRGGLPNTDGDLGYHGGIIDASHTLFKNNWRDVEFLEYKNEQNGTELANVSDFRSCHFIKDNDYQGTYDENNVFLEAPYCAVSMWGVKGVRFRNCTFSNTYNGYVQEIPAIFAINASPQVKNYCHFNGWSRGVEVHNYCTSVHNIEVSNSTFDDNRIGVYIAASSNALIIDNDINVTKDAVPTGQNNKIPVGLYLDHSTAYTVEENEFKGIGVNGQAIGLIVNGSGPVNNEIKGNLFDYFEALSTTNLGAAAYGVNRIEPTPQNDFSTDGLKFTCNDFGLFNANDLDLFVAAGETPDPQDGIADVQGEPNQGADNLFSVWPGTITNIDNEVNGFDYYYSSDNNRYNPEVTGLVSEIGTNQSSNFLANCGVSFTQSSQSGLPTLQAELTTINNDLTFGKAKLQNLIDNGSTPALEADILLANAQQYQDLYLDLMSIAPFVSEENLINLCELEDFPELALRNVMIANPHASRSDEVMQALVERQPPLAQQTLDDIDNLQQTITTKDVLEGQLSGWASEKQRLVRTLIYRYGSDSLGVNHTALSNLLSNQTERAYRYQNAEYLFHKGQTSQALSLLDSIAQGASFSDYAFLAHQDLRNYYQSLSNDASP